MSSPAQGKETGRVEAFSDGVFAIAITLLILEVKVPHLPEEGSGRSASVGICVDGRDDGRAMKHRDAGKSRFDAGRQIVYMVAWAPSGRRGAWSGRVPWQS